MGWLIEKSSVFTSPNVLVGGLEELSPTNMAPSGEWRWGGTAGSPKRIKFQMTARDRNCGLKPARWKLSSVRSDVVKC